MRLLNFLNSRDEQPDEEPLPEPQPASPIAQKPGAPQLTTPLKLSDERLAFVENYLLTRIDELRTEMGLDAGGRTVTGEWMGLREKYQNRYDKDFSDRKKPGTIFMESNLTTGETKRYVREMTAKVSDDLVGTTPFFSCMKRPRDVTDVASAAEEYIQNEVEVGGVQHALSMAIKVALIRNECVLKIGYDYTETPYFGPATVLVNERGEAIKTRSGHYVYQNDNFLPDPNVEGLFRLQKDPFFVMKRDQYRYQSFPRLEQKIVQRDRVDVAPIDYRSFLCPLRVPCIHKADINVHLYDLSEQDVAERFGGFESFTIYDRRSRITDEQSGESKARETQGEKENEPTSSLVRKQQIAECYVRMDADDDGRAEELMIVLNLTAKKMVFWDYLANQMGKRPFEVIVGVERVPNRWYGVGIMHMMEDTADYIDAQFNRTNVKDSRSESATFRQPNAVKEWKSGLDTVLGTSAIYDLEPGYDKDRNPPLFRVNLQEVSELGMELMEKMQQQGNLQFGVISAKDASASNLNNSRTATGILNIERTANMLTKSTENDMQIGIRDTLIQVAEVVLENMDPAVMFFDRRGETLLSLNREEVRSFDRDVKLLLTRSRSSESLATNQQAIVIMKDYRVMMVQDPEGAKMMRDTYIEELKALEVKDADKKLPEITPEMIQAFNQRQAEAAKNNHAAFLRELMNYKDTPESVKRQMEADAGFHPAPPEEVALEKRLESKQKEPAPKK